LAGKKVPAVVKKTFVPLKTDRYLKPKQELVPSHQTREGIYHRIEIILDETN